MAKRPPIKTSSKGWSSEEVRRRASLYSSRREFELEDRNAYRAACRHGWLDDLCSHMLPRRFCWTHEKLTKTASKYLTRASFEQGHPAAYKAAQRRGLLDQVCAHMTPAVPVWDFDRTAAEAMKYISRSALRAGSGSAYNAALRNGWLEEICSHMQPLLRYWSVADLEAEAGKYSSVAEFKVGSPSAYAIAARRNLLDRITSSLSYEREQWTKAEVLAEAEKYSVREDFHCHSRGAYKHAYRGRYLDEACSHMPYTRRGFDVRKPGFVYLVLVISPELDDLVKVGITNTTVATRMYGMRRHKFDRLIVLCTWYFPDGAQAGAAEKLIHERMHEFAYQGDARLSNGNTELFTLTWPDALESAREVIRTFDSTDYLEQLREFAPRYAQLAVPTEAVLGPTSAAVCVSSASFHLSEVSPSVASQQHWRPLTSQRLKTDVCFGLPLTRALGRTSEIDDEV
ncbi:MAG: GIY-YIG nuclease family protein [Candidatus Nanopelagicales bacterium]